MTSDAPPAVTVPPAGPMTVPTPAQVEALAEPVAERAPGKVGGDGGG